MGGSPSRLLMEGWVFENEGGCKCCQRRMYEERAAHLEMREAVAARRNSAGVSRVLARVRLVMKEAASSLQRPPTSIPKTTRRHLELRRGSG